MARCRNICCCCTAKAGVVMAAILATASSLFYFFMAFMAFADLYITHPVIDGAFVFAGVVSLSAAAIVIVGVERRREAFLMAFAIVYGIATITRGLLFYNAVIVVVRWAPVNWKVHSRQYVKDEDGIFRLEYGQTQENNAILCCVVTAIFAVGLAADVWAVLATIVYRTQLVKTQRKIAAKNELDMADAAQA